MSVVSDSTDEETPPSASSTSNAVCQGMSTAKEHGNHTAMIVPVWLSNQDSGCSEELLVYAMLDTQSDTTFILGDTGERIGAFSDPVCLTLSTMTSNSKQITCNKYYNLAVRGFNSSTKIALPPAYSRSYIPANRNHIPVSITAAKWPHLSHLVQEIPEIQDCDISLLIGYNCSQALAPEESLKGKNGQPFAIKTALGWSIVGPSLPVEDSGDTFGLCHRVETQEVLPASISKGENFRKEVKFTHTTKIKEQKILQVLQQDFQDEQYGHENTVQ